jgi:hypothetical protein
MRNFGADMEKEVHFSFSKKRLTGAREGWKDGVLPFGGILLITGVLVAVFALFISWGRGMEPVVPPHLDDGEAVDSSPTRLAFMCIAFVLAFVFGALACRKGRNGKILPAFLLGYTGGTLLWQSTGECAWHFSIEAEDYLMCFPHIEGASALILVIVSTILLIYCYRRNAFDWGVWVFVLSFIGNWFGHFAVIGTYPLVSSLMEEAAWFKGAGLTIGLLTAATALLLNFHAARSRQARLCCCLLFYFGIGQIVTGVSGI